MGRLAAPLARARYEQGRLAGRADALDAASRRAVALATLTEDVVASAALEGRSLDPGGVRAAIAGRLGGMPDVPLDGIAEIALDAARDPAAPLTGDRLRAWHAALGTPGFRRVRPGRADATEAFLAWFEEARGAEPVLGRRPRPSPLPRALPVRGRQRADRAGGRRPRAGRRGGERRPVLQPERPDRPRAPGVRPRHRSGARRRDRRDRMAGMVPRLHRPRLRRRAPRARRAGRGGCRRRAEPAPANRPRPPPRRPPGPDRLVRLGRHDGMLARDRDPRHRRPRRAGDPGTERGRRQEHALRAGGGAGRVRRWTITA